jgi:DNA-binding CsgD family transcriptional regulator
MPTGHLHEGDVDLLLRVLEDAHADAEEPAEGLPWALLDGLQELIPCDWDVSYQHHVPAGRRSVLMQGCGEEGRFAEGPVTDPPDDPFWQLWDTSMCSWPQRSGDLTTVIHTGDFFGTDRARRADPMCRFMGQVRFTMIVSLPAPAGEVRRVLFMRSSGPAFTERDRQVLALLRPHLQELWLRAEERRRAVPHLSEREWQVLELAASGLTYAEVAARLFLSTGTVRKHMEHVRERLCVHSVAAAAARALPRPRDPGRTASRGGGPAPAAPQAAG